tara:strand:- start:39 stop:1433 length:1395 start_codon:yes stop_codon:yes gene_type:complete
MADTTGWVQQTDPYEYAANFRLAMKAGQELRKHNVPVYTNSGSGDFNVYKDNGLLPGIGEKIYSFSAKTGKETITNQVDFDAFFTGENAAQLDRINKITKKATIALAKDAIKDNHPQTKANWTRLINSPGYISLGKNAGTDNPNDQNNDLRRDAGAPSGDFDSPNKIQEQSFAVGGSTEVLRYPRQSLEQFGYDYIQITAFEYEASGMPQVGGKKDNSFGKRFKKSYETIQLPMQTGLSESIGVGWGQDTLNAVQSIAAGAAMSAMQGVANIGDPAARSEAGKGLAEAGQQVGALAKDSQTEGFLKAYFAGQAVGANVVTRSTGNVINPNMELLFSGPEMRTFNFNFTLTPRDREEARTVRKIIRAMKRNMSPQRSESNVFLKTPRIFKIEYIYGEGNTPHPFLNKFKPCACRNFTVNYTPDGSYMTYAGEPSMTSYQIAMAFGEIEPIYADEYKGINSPTTGF